jgi:hypothetical protein
MSALESLSLDDKKKVDAFIEKAKAYIQEIDDDRASIKELAKKLADELGVKPKLLMTAVRTAIKDDLAAKQEEMESLTVLMNAAGYA